MLSVPLNYGPIKLVKLLTDSLTKILHIQKRYSQVSRNWSNLPQLIIVYPYEMQQVYDYDTFSADDIMGEAEIDIQSMITSATAFGDAGMFGNMQIGKWLKSHDNALLEDSTVNIVDGKVKQEVSLKLQNVESGEIDLQLEWIPLDQ